ncbi:hypothetical protein V8C40DRAFT_268336 [Trichoderma camerunense]
MDFAISNSTGTISSNRIHKNGVRDGMKWDNDPAWVPAERIMEKADGVYTPRKRPSNTNTPTGSAKKLKTQAQATPSGTGWLELGAATGTVSNTDECLFPSSSFGRGQDKNAKDAWW